MEFRETERRCVMTERANSLAKEYARENWGKDYSYTMLPDDPVFARELRNIKELEGIIRWCMVRFEHSTQIGGGE